MTLHRFVPLLHRADALFNAAFAVALLGAAEPLAAAADLGSRTPLLALAAVGAGNAVLCWRASAAGPGSTGGPVAAGRATVAVDLAFAALVAAWALLGAADAAPWVRWGALVVADGAAVVGVVKGVGRARLVRAPALRVGA